MQSHEAGDTPAGSPEPRPNTVFVKEPKLDIEMGILSSGGDGNSRDLGAKKVLGRQSFEKHCDDFLLGNSQSIGTERKENTAGLVLKPYKTPGCDGNISQNRAANPLSSSSSSLSSEADGDKSSSSSGDT